MFLIEELIMIVAFDFIFAYSSQFSGRGVVCLGAVQGGDEGHRHHAGRHRLRGLPHGECEGVWLVPMTSGGRFSVCSL